MAWHAEPWLLLLLWQAAAAAAEPGSVLAAGLASWANSKWKA